MTGLATFGELLDVARTHLEQAAAVPGRPPDVGRDLPDIRSGLCALVTEIGRCLPDDIRGNGLVLLQYSDSSSPWPAACAQAKRSAARAARVLAPALASARRRSTLVTERGRHLQAAARALAAGHDLLATHVGNDTEGERVARSAWAAVLGAPAISRAAAAEIGALARQAAALGAGLAMATPADWAEISQARRDLAGACGYLRTLTGAITAAHRQEPVLAVDRAVLRAIPVATRPTRRLPGPRDPVAALCQGVIGAAERLCYSARQAAGLAWSSPEVSADSLRHSAAAAVAASHHCSVLLGTLEERAGITVGRGEDVWAGFGLAVALAEAGQAAGRARDSWQGVTRTLDQVTSDVPGQVGAEVCAMRDLAVWTGRLAYADPRWTPASGPRAKVRRAADLAPEPRDAAVVVAAVHHASDSLARLAEVHEQRARLLARAGRLLAPARSRPARDGGFRTYGVAPPERIAVVMSGYRQASEANAEAETRVAVVADATRSPSATLTRVRELTAGTGSAGTSRAKAVGMPADIATYEIDDMPGPVERSLQMLGVADPERTRRAVAIDRAGEQLIVEACVERAGRPEPLTELAAAVREKEHLGWAPGSRADALTRGVTAPELDRPEPEREPE